MRELIVKIWWESLMTDEKVEKVRVFFGHYVELDLLSSVDIDDIYAFYHWVI